MRSCGLSCAIPCASAEDLGASCCEVLKEYPTPPNCTSPYAPTWIAEMARRQDLDRRGRAS